MVAVLAFLFACGASEPVAPPAVVESPKAEAPAPSADAAPTEVDIAAFHKARSAGEVPVLVDVRTQGEWDGGHVPGATHIPMDQVEARLSELDAYKDGPIYVICASGGRSGRVAAQLRGAGYQAVNVQGGTNGWKAAGHPVE